MQIECPGCGSRYRMNPDSAGRTSGRVRCPKCSKLFTVDLSTSAALPTTPPATVNAATATPGAGAAQGAATILVVDDARFFRELIVDVLQPLECRVLTAADAESALDLARRERPELVILDLNLPGMNGYDLTRALRSEFGAGIKLLAMSGVFRKDEEIIDVSKAGADDFTSKSFKPAAFLARVRKLLGA